ncbi:MAG: hypothetical protein U5K76_04320 [Woeseiaceae bacterium]|nr:hypothetical protein [Woeseiaceae bacterium]
MNTIIRRGAAVCAAVLAAGLLDTACAFDMNKSVRVEAGSQSGGHSTVNGSITVGRDAEVSGDVETVNGSVTIEENARIGNAETVNGAVRIASGVTADDVSSVDGSIRIGDNVTIDGEVSVVNGRIGIGDGSRIRDGVSNVNGEMQVAGAEIGGNLSTVNGDVLLTDGAVLQGDLIVEKPDGWNWSERRRPRVVIGPDARVVGEVRLEREVELFISESASVGGVSGVMTMDDADRFSGPRP